VVALKGKELSAVIVQCGSERLSLAMSQVFGDTYLVFSTLAAGADAIPRSVREKAGIAGQAAATSDCGIFIVIVTCGPGYILSLFTMDCSSTSGATIFAASLGHFIVTAGPQAYLFCRLFLINTHFSSASTFAAFIAASSASTMRVSN